MAQIGSIHVGERRMQELCARFGVDETLRYVDEALRYAGDRTAAEIRKIPNGVYTAEGWLDSDGYNGRTDVHIVATVTVEDESLSVDYTGSADQGNLNASRAAMQAAGSTPLTMTIDPDIPHNQGCLSRVTVHAPEGSICHAKYPGSTSYGTTLPADLMGEVVWKALAKARPEKVRAGTSRENTTPMLSGVDADGEAWGHMPFNASGGGGATHSCDGWPLIASPSCEGGLRTSSVEETELLFPLMFDRWEVERDSMGLGRHIGGPGVRMTLDENPVERRRREATTGPPRTGHRPTPRCSTRISPTGRPTTGDRRRRSHC